MKTILLLVIVLSFSMNSLAKNVKIDVVTGADGCPVLAEPNDPCSSGSEDVCFSKGMTHRITWKYKNGGGNSDAFVIEMKSGSDSNIFLNGCRTRGKHFTCDLKNTANSGSYAYSIVVGDTCRHDPKIIINQ